MAIKNKTIRFSSLASAESFASKVNGKVIECHGLEESRYKVQFKTQEGVYRGKNKPVNNVKHFVDFHAEFENNN